MADTEALYTVFESFCSFGSTRDLSTASKTASNKNLSGPQMDGTWSGASLKSDPF